MHVEGVRNEQDLLCGFIDQLKEDLLGSADDLACGSVDDEFEVGLRRASWWAWAAAAGPIDASASFETLERIAELIPAEWLTSVASGSPQDCARTIARQYDLGTHSVIMHGASPQELVPVVQTYRADRQTLRRAVAANPGRFA